MQHLTREAFPALFSQFQLGNLTLKNRIALAPMTRASADADGRINERMVQYYTRFANGGMGLIITEGAYIDEEFSQAYPQQPGLSNQKHVESWKPLIEAVHAHGTKIICQIMHAGALSQCLDTPIGPSAVKPQGEQMTIYFGSGAYKVPHEMSRESIRKVIADFASTAVRARAAGFDGVEIHGANGYVLDEFLTDYTNRRTDEYGGSTENRVRLLAEVVAAVRAAVGPDFAVGIRISQAKVNDYSHKWAGGEADAQVIFERLAAAKPDFIHTTEYDANQPAFGEKGPTLAALAKKYAKLPLLANGNLGEQPRAAENLLLSGDADMITLGKAALANPDWAKRLAAGMELEPFDGDVLQPVATIKDRELFGS